MARDEASHRLPRHAPDARHRAAHGMPEAVAEEARPGVLVHVVGRVFLAAADLVDHHTLLVGEAVDGHGAAEALLGEERERLLHVLVEDLEVQRDVLVAGVGVVLAAELGGAAVERRLVEAAWLSVAHPGLGEYYNAGWGPFFDRCPQKKFWLGLIPFYGWPGYLQILSAIDAYHGRTSDNLRPVQEEAPPRHHP